MKSNIHYFVLLWLALVYTMMLGGGCYEQLNVTRKVISAPPQSLAMLQGPYGFNPIRFWILFRPLSLLLFAGALVLSWKREKRAYLLSAFALDVLVIVTTYAYFAPETGYITSLPFEQRIDPAAVERASRWGNLNWIRMAVMAAVSLLLIYCTRVLPATRTSDSAVA